MGAGLLIFFRKQQVAMKPAEEDFLSEMRGLGSSRDPKNGAGRSCLALPAGLGGLPPV